MRRKKETNAELVSETLPRSSEAIFQSIQEYLNDEGEGIVPKTWYLDTGNLAFNYIVSGNLFNGWPSGQVCEIFGDPSTGKTLLMMKAIASIQAIGGIAIVNDVEHRWDWEFAKLHGVDPDKVLKDSPETIEDWSIRTDKILTEILEQDPLPKVLFCTDSVAAMSTYWEMEAVGVKEDQGKKAKRIKASMRVLPKKIAKAGAIFLASNHLIADPRITYGSNQITPGGKGITFQSSIRIELAKPRLLTLEGKSRPIGANLRLKCTKNSITPPFGECDINVMWSSGINKYSGLVDMMVDLDILSSSGGWFQYKDGKKFRATDIEEVIVETPEILTDDLWETPYFK